MRGLLRVFGFPLLMACGAVADGDGATAEQVESAASSDGITPPPRRVESTVSIGVGPARDRALSSADEFSMANLTGGVIDAVNYRASFPPSSRPSDKEIARKFHTSVTKLAAAAEMVEDASREASPTQLVFVVGGYINEWAHAIFRSGSVWVAANIEIRVDDQEALLPFLQQFARTRSLPSELPHLRLVLAKGIALSKPEFAFLAQLPQFEIPYLKVDPLHFGEMSGSLQEIARRLPHVTEAVGIPFRWHNVSWPRANRVQTLRLSGAYAIDELAVAFAVIREATTIDLAEVRLSQSVWRGNSGEKSSHTSTAMTGSDLETIKRAFPHVANAITAGTDIQRRPASSNNLPSKFSVEDWAGYYSRIRQAR